MTNGEITLGTREQTRLRILMDLEADRMSHGEGASALGISGRQLRNIRNRFRVEGVAGLVHGNRGRRPANASDPDVLGQVEDLWHRKYTGFNQVFFTEMLEREEGIALSRSTVRRSLAAKDIPAVRPQKRSRHRRHRTRRGQEGAMIQMDGSQHDWLGDRGPRLTLVGGIDDATSQAWAVFRLEEDTEGYFELLMEIAVDRGIPLSVYLDRTTIALGCKRTPERVAAGTTLFATQMTRVLNRLDITLIRARSPQAKGRVERLWRTLQDRLVCELRAKGITTLAGAQRVLRSHLHFHNRNFSVPARTDEPAWRSVPGDLAIADVICWTYSRTVRNDNTVSVDGTRYQLVFEPAHSGWANSRLLVSRRLDGTWFATRQGICVPARPIQLGHPTIQAA